MHARIALLADPKQDARHNVPLPNDVLVAQAVCVAGAGHVQRQNREGGEARGLEISRSPLTEETQDEGVLTEGHRAFIFLA